MRTFELPEDVENDRRVAVLAVGPLGKEVVEIGRERDIEIKFVHVETESALNELPPDFLRFLEEAGESAVNGEKGALLFVVGELAGELNGIIKQIAPRLSSQIQAVIVVGSLPPSFKGHEVRSAAVIELESLTAAGVSVIVVDSDHALRELQADSLFNDFQMRTAAHMARTLLGITDLIGVPGEVNVDFADIMLVLRLGTAGFFSYGTGKGLNRAEQAAKQALTRANEFPALRGGAKGCLLNITGSVNLTIDEVTTVASIIQEGAGDEADILFGAIHDPGIEDDVFVSALWTGFQPSAIAFDRGHAVLVGMPGSAIDVTARRRRPSSHSLKVFLASPSDVAEERELAKQAIDELNLQNAARWGTNLELVRWETHAVPAMGRAQEVVTKTTKFADIDIFVGLLWSRLGTPTGEAESGTVEEFNEAYASWRKNGTPWIAFYFCDRPVQYGGIGGAEQMLGVARFREQFPEKGMYFTYSNAQQLEQLLIRHLSRIVEELLDKRSE